MKMILLLIIFFSANSFASSQTEVTNLNGAYWGEAFIANAPQKTSCWVKIIEISQGGPQIDTLSSLSLRSSLLNKGSSDIKMSCAKSFERGLTCDASLGNINIVLRPDGGYPKFDREGNVKKPSLTVYVGHDVWTCRNLRFQPLKAESK
jgi:hypothetical protein